MKATVLGLMGLASVTQLTGCETPYKDMVVKIKAVETPVALSQKCSMSPPMAKEAYLLLDKEEREDELAKYIVRLAGDLKVCDSRLEAVRKYEAEVIRILSTGPDNDQPNKRN